MKFAPSSRKEWIRAGVVVAVLLAPVVALLLYFAIVVVPMPGRSFQGTVPVDDAARERAERMREVVTVLSEDIGQRDVFNVRGLERARADLVGRFEALGYDVVERPFRVSEGDVYNLEVERTGTAQPDAIVLIGAHYDTAPGTRGANDNGSGVAALLELAAAFAEREPERTVRFVAFVNEEPPFFDTAEMGSAVYAAEAAARGDHIVAMISLETMGFYSDEPGSQQYPPPFGLFYPSRGNFVAFVGNVQSRALVRHSVGLFREHGQVPSEGVAAPGRLPGIFWSDHAPFWEHGYAALMVTDTAPFRYQHYHRWTDTAEHIDFDTLAMVVDGLVGVVDGLARADAPTF